ncbi:MAG: hypothetical protein MZW92_61060 [Comamonadaceae bacterium]|nr:hypothetical protein [Comamonadaceae bacterium]
MQAALSRTPARKALPTLGLFAALLAAVAPAYALNLTTFAGITGPLTTALTTIAGLTPEHPGHRRLWWASSWRSFRSRHCAVSGPCCSSWGWRSSARSGWWSPGRSSAR